MYLKSFSVKGYRSFSDAVQLNDISTVTIIYGLNNAGKTNLLRALALFSSVCRQDLFQLLAATARNAKNIYEELNEDIWMFCLNTNQFQEITISAIHLSLLYLSNFPYKKLVNRSPYR